VLLGLSELLARIAADRGLDFELPPPAVTDALPDLATAVHAVLDRCQDSQELRWLAAALAALSHQVQARAITPA
jgi:hypothetical protein